MLPKGFLVGNIASDPQSGVSQINQNSYTKFAVACNDGYSRASAQPKSHFFNCISWGKKSQFVQNFIKKGDKVFIEFFIVTRSYVNQDGRNVKTFDLVVENIESLSRLNSNNISPSPSVETPVNSEEEGSEDELDEVSIDDIYV